MNNRVSDPGPGYVANAEDHPAWCDEEHEGTYHQGGVDSWTEANRWGTPAQMSVELVWDAIIDGTLTDEPPMVHIDAPEFLHHDDARRLAVALLQAASTLRGEHATCPDCGRVGTLLVRLAERHAECTACGTVWDDDSADPGLTFGRLAAWLA